MRAAPAAATNDIAEADDFARTGLPRRKADGAALAARNRNGAWLGTTTGMAGSKYNSPTLSQ
jgi:hypothetical protein